MQVVRRIAGCPRYRPCESDEALRVRVAAPSLQSILVRSRLRYLGRLVLRTPGTSLALIGSRPGGCKLPWVRLVEDDMAIAQRQVARLACLPPPHIGAMEWFDYIRTLLGSGLRTSVSCTFPVVVSVTVVVVLIPVLVHPAAPLL